MAAKKATTGKPSKSAASKKVAPKKKAVAKRNADADAAPPASPWLDDERITTARKNVRTILTGYNTEEMMDEIMDLHRSTKARSLKTLRSVKDMEAVIVDAGLENQAVRSRIAEIEMQVMRPVLKAKALIELAGDYIRETHGPYLASAARTIAERQSLIDSVFQRESMMIRDLQNVQAIAEKAIRDLDQSAFRISGAQNALASLNQRRV